jgi:hypothetical protein
VVAVRELLRVLAVREGEVGVLPLQQEIMEAQILVVGQEQLGEMQLA